MCRSGWIFARAREIDTFLLSFSVSRCLSDPPLDVSRVSSVPHLVTQAHASPHAAIVGSFVAENVGWRDVFWVMFAFAGACELIVIFFLPGKLSLLLLVSNFAHHPLTAAQKHSLPRCSPKEQRSYVSKVTNTSITTHQQKSRSTRLKASSRKTCCDLSTFSL